MTEPGPVADCLALTAKGAEADIGLSVDIYIGRSLFQPRPVLTHYFKSRFRLPELLDDNLDKDREEIWRDGSFP